MQLYSSSDSKKVIANNW